MLTRGTGALFTLAECYAQWGKPLAALGHYREYLKMYARLGPEDRKRQEERAKLASTQVAALSTLVPSLRIRLTDEQRTQSAEAFVRIKEAYERAVRTLGSEDS